MVDGSAARKIYALAVNSYRITFAATDSGVLKLEPGKTSFQVAGLTGRKVQALALDLWGNLYAGTIGWPYVSADNGETWTQVQEGLTIYDITSVAVGTDGAVYCGTWGDGVFKSTNLPEPVMMTHYTADRTMGGAVHLQWETTREMNNRGFEVQRAVTSDSFQTVAGSSIAGGGANTQKRLYEFVDSTASGVRLYYRLKQTILDGTVHYGPMRTVEALTGIARLPNR